MSSEGQSRGVCFPLYRVEASCNLYRLNSRDALERIELRDIKDDQIFDSAFRRAIVEDDVRNPGRYRLSVDTTITATESAQGFEALCREMYAETFADAPGYAPDRDLIATIEALITIEADRPPKTSLWRRWFSRSR